MTTIKDVAKRAGVHPTVVSRVLNKDQTLKIKDSTRERILETVKELNYFPNRSAQNLKRNETKMLGMVIPDFANPVYSEIIHGAEDQAAKEGYNLMVYSMKQKGTEHNKFSHLIEGRTDGLLIAISESEDQEIVELQESKKPFLLINRMIPGINHYVVLDDEFAGKLATDHLIQLGHRKIAHITGPFDTGTGKTRFNGYKQAMHSNELEILNDYVQESSYSIESGYSAMKKLLALKEPPTAVFAGSILAALGAMRAAYEAGRTIPNDFSLVSIHDVPFADALQPPLTTIKMPLYEMGQEAVKNLVQLIKKDTQSTHLTINGAELIKRNSTAELLSEK
ncbi:LacI family DNA-binding transcriptional regulator [Corticicoccus populi]|uniref:LacI family DNA-binding transcriptional regulator n=1 Tax=Corticicoccus populi TaxID=1812821 RepID=A0ABW5WW26_9STAP